MDLSNVHHEFFFWQNFVPYATWAVFCSMVESLDIQLLPLFVITSSAVKGNSLKKILTFIEILYNLFISKWIWSYMCPIWNMTPYKLMEEHAIMGHPSHYSIGPSQLKFQKKRCGLKASAFLNKYSVPYATLCPIHNAIFMFWVYWTTKP